VVRFNLEEVDGDGSAFDFKANRGDVCLVMDLTAAGAKAEALPAATALITKTKYFIVVPSNTFLRVASLNMVVLST
jgi:hypothetical protein